MLNWLEANVELIGAITGLLYLFFSIKQKIWLWPLGIITSAFYVYVFYQSNLYADMSLNVYYVVISFYGWYHWLFGNKSKKRDDLSISTLKLQGWLLTIISIIVLWIIWGYVLITVPEILGIPPSDLPYWDSFTTSASIVATYLLARKKIEQWILWVVIDAISAGLYLYKQLYPTLILFIIYTILAVVGYYEWKKVLGCKKDKT